MSERWPNESDKLGTAEWVCEECGLINSTDFLTCDDCGWSQDGVPPQDELSPHDCAYDEGLD
jgi:hypothetical protein